MKKVTINNILSLIVNLTVDKVEIIFRLSFPQNFVSLIETLFRKSDAWKRHLKV